jgi:hypothetical protein
LKVIIADYDIEYGGLPEKQPVSQEYCSIILRSLTGRSFISILSLFKYSILFETPPVILRLAFDSSLSIARKRTE